LEKERYGGERYVGPLQGREIHGTQGTAAGSETQGNTGNRFREEVNREQLQDRRHRGIQGTGSGKR
jgi:hypothetical protein